MPPSPEDAPPLRWRTWLRALWGDAAAIEWQLAGGSRPVLTGRGDGERLLHLAPGADERLGLAAAAHAAAHWRFGGPVRPRAGLKPVQQALFAVLEDARIEALALRQLPGLRALWLPFHAGEDAPAGNGFDALLARLARDLLEPVPADPHPWIARARALVFAPDGALALATPEAVRVAASRLGNDIGQMRLPFNPSTWRMHAAYRDDGSWLWEPEADAAASQTTLAQPALQDAAMARPEAARAEVLQATACYPEWDARIGRYRADWCSVYSCEPVPLPGEAAHLRPARSLVRALQRGAAQLRGPWPRLAGRDDAGEELHPVAALEFSMQKRAGRVADERVYRRRTWPTHPLAVQILLDASASTAEAGAAGEPLLTGLLRLALACCEALDVAGHRSALMTFCSRTRERVEVRPLKQWHEDAAAPLVGARCAAQRSSGSTRTGAAVRHATQAARAFAAAGHRRPIVLVLTDGEVHDVDAPDPAYLRGDLRQAIVEAWRQGVAVHCLQARRTTERVLAGRVLSLLAPGGQALPTIGA